METVSVRGRFHSSSWAFFPTLSDILLSPPPRGFDSLAAVPSNVNAVETGLLFSNGMVSFAAILGPSGWGKSHLLEAVSNRIRSERGHRFADIWSAPDWAHSPLAKPQSTPLILDNVQDVASRPRSRQIFRLALERRVRAGWPTLLAFTETRVTRTIRALLPNWREWRVATIQTPHTAEREVIAAHMAAAEGVGLAPELRRILAHRLGGDGRALLGALKRLKLAGSTWSSARDVLQACGLLNPFFASSSAWDLRDHLAEHAEEIVGNEAHVSRGDWTAFSMLRLAHLSEAEVARYLKIEPGKVYAAARRAEKGLEKDPEAQARAELLIDRAVRALQPTPIE